MKLLHVTLKEHLDSILENGLRAELKRIQWEGEDGTFLEDRIAPPPECPPAIYAYPLVEDEKARYNCWVVDDDMKIPTAHPNTCGIIFEPVGCFVCIGSWAFGSDFVTRKRPIRWENFKVEAKAVTAIAGAIQGISTPNIYDAIDNYDIFTKDNYHQLMADSSLPAQMENFLWSQFSELDAFYSPGFEVCVMYDVIPSQIMAFADLDGVTESEDWYDEALTNKRIRQVELHR